MAELWQVAIVAYKRITSVYIFTNVQNFLNAIKKLLRKGFVTFASKTKAPFFGYIAINGFHGIVANKLIAKLKRREIAGVHGKREMVKLAPRALTIQPKGAVASPFNHHCYLSSPSPRLIRAIYHGKAPIGEEPLQAPGFKL